MTMTDRQKKRLIVIGAQAFALPKKEHLVTQYIFPVNERTGKVDQILVKFLTIFALVNFTLIIVWMMIFPLLRAKYLIGKFGSHKI